MKKLICFLVVVCFCIGAYASVGGEYQISISKDEAQEFLSSKLPLKIINRHGVVKITKIDFDFLLSGAIEFDVTYQANIKGETGTGKALFTSVLVVEGKSVLLSNTVANKVSFKLDKPLMKKGLRSMFRQLKHNTISKKLDDYVANITNGSDHNRLLIQKIEQNPIYRLGNDSPFFIKALSSIAIINNKAMVTLSLI